MLRSALTLVVLGVLAVSPLRAADSPAPKISYKDDRLTMQANDVPVGDVLEELKRQSGAEIPGNVPSGKVSASLDAVPLQEALGRLLGDRSFTLTYADDGRLKTIELKGGPQEGKPVAKETAPATETANKADEAPVRSDGASKKERWDAVGHALQRGRAVPVDGQLAKMNGKSEVSWESLLRTAGAHEDMSMRLEAVRAGAREIDQNPDIRDAVLQALTPMSNEELAQLARAMASPSHAQEATKFVLRYTRSPELRDRLRATLRQLRIEDRQRAASSG